MDLPVCASGMFIFFRGVEDESITSPKGKRDYICLVDNMLIIAGEDKTSKTQMAEADNDLVKKHVGSNRAMYGRLQYIILIGTAGPDLKFNAMSVIPGSALQELFPAMEVRCSRICLCSRPVDPEWQWSHVHYVLAPCVMPPLISTNALQVTSQINRQKALLMFINLVRWVRTVHDQHVLPMHKHQLFRNMPRPSPYPGE